MFESCRAHFGMRRMASVPAEPGAVADVPDQLTLSHHRDHEGREHRPWARLALLTLVGVLLLLGLLNVFGQRPDTDFAASSRASLKVYSPTRIRGGLFFESRFTIEAREELKNATLVLDPGWLEGITLNTVEPAPVGEASRDGRLALELGRIPAGAIHHFFLQFQVNPTNVGRRSQDVDLADGEERLLHIDRTVTVFP
jgi:hypothetical protein